MTRLIQQGDKFMLPIGPEVLKSLGITADTPLDVTAKSGRLVVEPQRAERKAEIGRLLNKIDGEYGGVLKRLAE